MNILLDTNILIPIFDIEHPLDERFAKMQRLLDSLSFHVFMHPAQRDDFERDSDTERKKRNLSRLPQHNVLESPPIPSEEELRKFSWTQTTDNDRVDNLLLYALKTQAVHILVSDDNGIISKAKRSGLQERVYRLDQFLFFLESQLSPKFTVPLGIEDKFLYELKHPEADFWNSLRESYNGFDDWFIDKAREHRKAWSICDTNGYPLAVCIYKEENSPVVTDDSNTRLSGKVLKLCTFKVDKKLQGRKLGERLLFTAFRYAVEHNMNYVYLHTKAQDKLIDLCIDFGFSFLGKYDGDEVWVKQMMSPIKGGDYNLSPLDYAKSFYPHFVDDERVKKFIVPIQPQYHNELFPDISDDAFSLFAKEFSPKTPQSNTIKKAYLCWANTDEIEAGDILLFYRTEDRRSVEVIGVVEYTCRTSNIAEALALVSKRTVFPNDELQEMLKKETLIILFRFAKTIPAISFRKFLTANIKGNIQTIRRISHNSYLQLVSSNE